MRLHLVWLVVVLLGITSAAAWSQADESGSQDGDGDGEKRAMTPGLIFNTSNLLLDLSAYEGGVAGSPYRGGIGAKLDFSSFALRGLFSFRLENADTDNDDNNVDFTLGVSAQMPFFHGRVTPYWGGFVDGTLSKELNGSDEAVETTTTVVGGALGPLLGAEFFIFDYLSVFAEYALAFRIARATVVTDTGDDKNEEQTTNYRIGTRLGNAGSLGVVIYLLH